VGLTRNGAASWSGRDVRVVIDPTGAPIIVYNIDGEFNVAERWNGSDWTLLSGRLNLGASAAHRPRVAIAGNTLVVAWIEAGQVAIRRLDLTTSQWDAGVWVPGPNNPLDIDLAVDAGGLAVIAYSEGLLGSTLYAVRQINASAWTSLGEIGTRPSTAPVLEFGVHLGVFNLVRVVWIEDTGNFFLRAAQFDGTTWTPLTGLPETRIVQSSLRLRSLSVNRGLSPFAFAYALDTAAGSDVGVHDVTPSGLVPVGPVITSHPRVGQLSLAMTQPNQATLAQSQRDATGTFRLAVRRHTP
jgi:hypothetical protein